MNQKLELLREDMYFFFIHLPIYFFFQIYGDGSNTRSFQYVSDLVDGLIKLMNSNYTGPVNIGNPTEHTIQGKKLFSDRYLWFVHISCG